MDIHAGHLNVFFSHTLDCWRLSGILLYNYIFVYIYGTLIDANTLILQTFACICIVTLTVNYCCYCTVNYHSIL